MFFLQDTLAMQEPLTSKKYALIHGAKEVLKEINNDLGKERLFSEKIKVSRLLYIVQDKTKKVLETTKSINEKLSTAKVYVSSRFKNLKYKMKLVNNHDKKITSGIISNRNLTLTSINNTITPYTTDMESEIKERVNKEIDAAMDEYFNENVQQDKPDGYKDGESMGTSKIKRDHNHYKTNPNAPDISQT